LPWLTREIPYGRRIPLLSRSTMPSGSPNAMVCGGTAWISTGGAVFGIPRGGEALLDPSPAAGRREKKVKTQKWKGQRFDQRATSIAHELARISHRAGALLGAAGRAGLHRQQKNSMALLIPAGDLYNSRGQRPRKTRPARRPTLKGSNSSGALSFMIPAALSSATLSGSG